MEPSDEKLRAERTRFRATSRQVRCVGGRGPRFGELRNDSSC